MHTLRQLRSKNKAKHIAAAIGKTIKAVFVKELQAEVKNNFCLNCLKLPIACLETSNEISIYNLSLVLNV